MRDAAKMLAAHPLSKITQENLEVFIDVFETQVEELCNLLRNITDCIDDSTSLIILYYILSTVMIT